MGRPDGLAADELADLGVHLGLALGAGERQQYGALHEDHVHVGRRHELAGAGPGDSVQPGAHALHVGQQRALHDLEAAPGSVGRLAQHREVLLQARVVDVVGLAGLGHDHARGHELRHVVHVARGRVRPGVLDQAVGQPDDLLHAEPLAQQRFVVGAAQPQVAVVQQALLGGEQRALAVGVEGAALEHERRLVELRAPGLGDARRRLSVLVVGRELLVPAVEAELHGGHAAVAVAHEDGSVVADPGVVEGDGEEVDAACGVAGLRAAGPEAEQLARLVLLRRVHHHGDRLEAGDAARDRRPLLAGGLHERPEEVLAAGPREQGARGGARSGAAGGSRRRVASMCLSLAWRACGPRSWPRCYQKGGRAPQLVIWSFASRRLLEVMTPVGAGSGRRPGAGFMASWVPQAVAPAATA